MTWGPPGRSRRRRQSIGRIRRGVAALACTLILSNLQPLVAQETPPPLESQVKAAFLFNFAKFVEWPSDQPRGADDAFVICVYDDETLARALDQAVSGKMIEGRPLRVSRLPALDDTRTCKMLYLGSSTPSRLSALLKSLGTTAVLTVGNVPGFTRQGGIINFVMQDNRVRFEINPGAADRAGLRISSKLLQLATIVRDAAKVESER